MLLRPFSLPLMDLFLLPTINAIWAIGNDSLYNISYNRWLIHYIIFNGVFEPLYLLKLGQKRIEKL